MDIIQKLNLIAKDKWEHYAIAITLTCFLRVFLPRLIAALIAIAICIGKEIYDKVSGKGTPEWKDLLADLLGVAVGIM